MMTKTHSNPPALSPPSPLGPSRPTPFFLQTYFSGSSLLTELEQMLDSSSSSVVVDNLRAYMQIIDMALSLGLDIYKHAFQLFRDCCSATCLRNRSVKALVIDALVQAIRKA